ncbi:alpha/beta hydrolase, partial [Bacteroidota bacterium]
MTKSKVFIIVVLFCCFLFLHKTIAQDSTTALKYFPQVTILNTEVVKKNSSYNNEEYQIYIALPYSYYDSSKTYPVLYITDADGAFGSCTEISRLFSLGGEIPEIIIVGIAYGISKGVSFNQYMYNRRRDYTPTTIDDDQSSGGAGKFLRFIQEDIIPYIDKNYHTDQTSRAIAGASHGGLFVLYTLFHEVELFNYYISISPSLWWDNKVMFEFEQKYHEKNTDLPVKLFLSVGALEGSNGYIQPLKILTDIIKNRKYPSLIMNSIIL